MIVSLGICHLGQVWGGSRVGLKDCAHFSVEVLAAQNWIPLYAGFVVNPLQFILSVRCLVRLVRGKDSSLSYPDLLTLSIKKNRMFVGG